MAGCSQCGDLEIINSGKCRPCYNKYMREYMLKRYHKQREEAIVKLGGRCVDCGATKELEFDHLDPAKKSFTISSSEWSTTILNHQVEVAKCALRCKPCHIERTRKQKMSGAGCGQRGVWRCPCTACKAFRREHQRTWRMNRGR